MKSLLILPHIKVEGANAVSGLVYGFPAVTHFLGFLHALSRELDARLGVKLGGCGIVCHDYQIHAHKNGKFGEHIFSLTRNPLTKEGKTAPFNEEGKMRMEISLLVECDFTSDDFDFDTSNDIERFTELVYRLAVMRRLAGGVITTMAPVKFYEIVQDEEKAQNFYRRILFRMMPGFVLCDRSRIFNKYLSEKPDMSPFEVLLDFYTLKSRAALQIEEKASENNRVKWETISKPSSGWVVPIQIGYKAISSLYENEKVSNTRTADTPFCFVEPIYGLGEWLGPQRVQNNIESIFWRYQTHKGFYLCVN